MKTRELPHAHTFVVENDGDTEVPTLLHLAANKLSRIGKVATLISISYGNDDEDGYHEWITVTYEA